DLTIALELRFAWAPGSDPTTEPRHLLAATGQPWKPVLELRELDLDLSLARAGMAREDVEDHGGAIDHRNAGCVFEGALLRRRELVIGDHDVGAQTFGFAADAAATCPRRRRTPPRRE